MSNQYLSVSQLTRYLSRKFEKDPYLQTVYLTGEISNFDRNDPNRHQYFTLKDEKSQLPVVMFQSDFKKIKFKPQQGDKVLVIGRVQLYQPHGKYQMVIQHMEPDGVGQLFRLLEETKQKLKQEGLFDFDKKPIPPYPQRIAVVTSSSGAVIHDIRLNVKKRYPLVQLVLFPTQVQGERAAESIVKNLKRADHEGSFDTIIVGRGGGSFEDLFAFNEESVVRAIAGCQTPVISSIGHETDTTLSDWVADYRASTPTEAAVVATPVMEELLDRIRLGQQRLNLAFKNHFQSKKKQVNQLNSSYVLNQPQRLYQQDSQRLDLAQQALSAQLKQTLYQTQQNFKHLSWRFNHLSLSDHIQNLTDRKNQLEAQLQLSIKQQIDQQKKLAGKQIQALDLLSPLTTLARGYSITSQGHRIIKSVEEVDQDEPLQIDLSDGSLDVQLKNIFKKDEDNDPS